jgi:hypothetical protein
MTDTATATSDLEARLVALVARLETLSGIETAAPMSITGLPPHVAAGELITSAWGNAVVDSLTKLDDALTTQQLLAITTGQAVAAGAVATISFTDVAGEFGAGPTTFGFPVTGNYVVSFSANGVAATASNDLVVTAAGTPYQGGILPGKVAGVVAFANLFQAGQQLSCSVYNANSVAVNFTASLYALRLSVT